MPRRPEPSFEVKKVIWDVAATVGQEKYGLIRRDVDIELGKRRRDLTLFEETPDVRTIKRIITQDINGVPPEKVISGLPRHVWALRHDYEDLKSLRERLEDGKSREPVSAFETARYTHLSEIRSMLEDWRKVLSKSGPGINLGNVPEVWIERDYLFPLLLEHCPSLRDVYDSWKRERDVSLKSLSTLIHMDMEAFQGKVEWQAELHGERPSLLGSWDTEEFSNMVFSCLFEGKALLPSESLESSLPDPINLWGTHQECIAEAQDFYAKLYATHYPKYAQQIAEVTGRLHSALVELTNAVDRSLASNEHLQHQCMLCP